MSYDLRELAEKYDSLDGFQKANVKIWTQGKVDNSWNTERPEDFNVLFECSWFHFEELGIQVGGDGRLRLEEGVISELENSAIKRALKAASDYISDYFSLVSKYIKNSELLDFGLLNRRRGGDFDLFG